MELFGAISAREWNSLNGIFSSDQEADYQLMAAHNFAANTTAALNYDHYHPSTLLRASSLEFPFPFADSYLSSPCSYDQPFTWVTGNTSTLALSEQDIAIRNPDLFLNTETAVESGSLLAGKPKKRSTSTISTVERDNDLELNNRRNFKPKRNKKLSMRDEEADDTEEPISPNSSQEELEGTALSLNSKGSVMALNLSGKARASKGSAMDPQSVYARKRREKINERLRTLQNLVPNGTKVDISTMLEEAVQYVKFLQLQIKLLSSDDLWIYAPLAYNGMNIGTDLRLSAPNQH